MRVPAGIRLFGSVPVPYTVAWTGEDEFYVAKCPVIHLPAICQSSAPGVGKPTFGNPHWIRQREAICNDLCDICGKSLKGRTKISLSHARARFNGANGMCVMQVEPLLHQECASLAMLHCPSLKKDIDNGTLFVRRVSQHRKQYAISDPQYLDIYVPGYPARPEERVAAHGKVELVKWKDLRIEVLQR